MNNLLSDEVDYDSQERLTQIQEIITKNQEINSSNHRKFQIKLKNYSQNFGIYWFLVKFFLMLSISLILQFIYFAVLYPKSKRITNLLKAYILGVETWSSFITVGSCMLQAIFWNNTGVVWNTDPLKYVENSVMNNITEALDYDLGNFTENYRSLFTKGNSCETVYFPDEHPYCYKYFNGLFNSNLYSSLRGMLESFRTIIFKWKTARESWDEVKKLMHMPEMMTLLALLSSIMTTTYYTITVGVSNTIILELERNLSFVNLYSSMFEYMQLVIYLATASMLIGQSQRIMERYYSIFYIIPFELLEANMAIRHKLKKIGDIAKFYKL